MKILLAVHGFPPENVGGTELYVQRLARALQDRGHEVVLVCGTLRYEDDEPRREAFAEDGLRGHWLLRADLYFDSWEKSYCPRTGRLFQEILREEKPDLVHVHHWVRLTRDLVHRSYLEGIPVAVTLHDLWSTCLICFRVKSDLSFCTVELAPENCIPCVGTPEWMGESEGKRAVELLRDDVRNELSLARAVIVPSRSQGGLIQQVTGVSSDRFHVVPHGAPQRLQPVTPRRGTPAVDRSLRIACWSHLYPQKGQHVLLEALNAMKAPQEVEVHLLGDCWQEDYRARLERLAAGKNVTFHGKFRPEEIGALQPDLAVYPTLCHESYSFVVDEAKMLGVPMLATDIGALRDRVRPGGALFPREDAQALARWLDRVLEEPGLLATWRAAIDPPSTFEDNVASLERIYASVVREGLSGAKDRFDRAAHEEFEAYRSEQRHRYLLRYHEIRRHAENLEREIERLRREGPGA